MSMTPSEPLLAFAAIEDGGLAEVEATVDGDAESLILHRDGDRVRGWFNVCPHALARHPPLSRGGQTSNKPKLKPAAGITRP